VRTNALNWMPETGEKINSDGANCNAYPSRCAARRVGLVFSRA
jgi:hypothetical protein